MKLSTLFHWAVYFYFGEESIRLIEGLCKYFKRKTMLRNSKIFYKKLLKFRIGNSFFEPARTL